MMKKLLRFHYESKDSQEKEMMTLDSHHRVVLVNDLKTNDFDCFLLQLKHNDLQCQIDFTALKEDYWIVMLDEQLMFKNIKYYTAGYAGSFSLLVQEKNLLFLNSSHFDLAKGLIKIEIN
jgi:hypothetical protein